MGRYSEVLDRIRNSDRYRQNVLWGVPRAGHPEGSIAAHIADLELNVLAIREHLTEEMLEKLLLLVHTHDTYSAEATPGVPIPDPKSHASLARAALAEHLDDSDLLAMVQYHDELYALWKQFIQTEHYNERRFRDLVQAVQDWDLFLIFNLVDVTIEGKDQAPLRWVLSELKTQGVPITVDAEMLWGKMHSALAARRQAVLE